ncbi:OmpA family protein [Pararhizobium gei]|uniref:OmpA family protein n=1 Tax=Pararhizobium gei TaxID=1395951 RepID=UPI0023D9793F|nr:OmpA family protein [Rhizobium gei]
MTIRSKLFATVALPVLSLSIAIQPALADSLMKPFEVAQEGSSAQQGEVAPEELPRKRKQRAEQPAEEGQSGQEQEPSRAERRKQRQTEEQPSQEQQEPSRAERRKRQAEQQQDAQPAEEQQEPSRAERRKRQAEQQKQQQEAQPAEETQEPSRAERRKRQAEEKQRQEAQPAEEQQEPSGAERRKQQQAERDKQRKQEQAKPATDAEAERAAEDRLKARAERRKRQEEQKNQSAKPAAEEAKPSTNDEAAKTAEERARIRAERRKQQQAEGQNEKPAAEGEQRPAADGEAANPDRKRPDRRKPAPEVVDKRSEQQKEELARDPARSDETVVLPVDNGAAVLDSDKDADNSDGNAREKRRAQRERARAENRNVEVPKSDEDAQRGRRDRRPSRDELDAANREEGRRVERVPEFGVEGLIDAFTGNDRRRPRVEESRDNRVVLDFGDQIIVRGDDRPRLRRNAQETFYEELPRGRHRETIERPNGVRIVTIYNQYGDIVQRTRIDREGAEYLMIYAPEVDEGPRPPAYDVGDDLPPMRLQVPVRDYIIDTSSEPDRDYYEFLSEPPVEQVERTYSIDEVRSSARIRDKVRRIDLDTITFASGSAEVPLSQAKTLRKVADAMLQVIEKDPGETFFIEGHTDAVGGDQPNLVLSDERAESVASLLTEVYEIPAENLVTQGYGERFLKVRTEAAEQENRRVTIRRVTPLVRPVAQN